MVGIQSLFDAIHDLDRVATGLLVDLDQHRIMPVSSDSQPLWRTGRIDTGDIIEPHQTVRTAAQNGFLDGLQRADAGVGQQEVELVMIFKTAHRLQYIAGRQGGRHITEGQPVGGQLFGIDLDPVLCLLPAHHDHPGHAVDGGQQRYQLVLGKIMECHRRETVRGQAIGGYRKHGWIDAPDTEAGTGRQFRQHLVDGGLDLQHGGNHVVAPAEVDR